MFVTRDKCTVLNKTVYRVSWGRTIQQKLDRIKTETTTPGSGITARNLLDLSMKNPKKSHNPKIRKAFTKGKVLLSNDLNIKR